MSTIGTLLLFLVFLRRRKIFINELSTYIVLCLHKIIIETKEQKIRYYTTLHLVTYKDKHFNTAWQEVPLLMSYWGLRSQWHYTSLLTAWGVHKYGNAISSKHGKNKFATVLHFSRQTNVLHIKLEIKVIVPRSVGPYLLHLICLYLWPSVRRKDDTPLFLVPLRVL